jgi:hypothetical protein
MTTLGFVERTCSACGREWIMTQAECSCGSHELTERIHEPTLIERVGGAIRAVAIPAKPKAPRASAAQVASLRTLQASTTALLVEIRVLDVQLRDAVVKDVDELQPAQGVVHQALSIEGDASWDRIPGLSLSLTAFAAALTRAIQHLEETK